ncbi:MAG: SDR family oxidoreductase [Paludibacteraceae bacterium]|nr:SDR family oxidoreductase [Paludibacteraceae bacterium]
MDTSYNPFSLQGKTILVTGASSGIGQETAIQCSKMGAKVIITARNEERLKETLLMMSGDGNKIVVSDLTNQTDLDNLITNVDTLNGLVLCAGKPKTLPFQFCTRENFDDVFNINFYAPVELLRLLVKKKKLVKESSVVFVSSIGGVRAYGASNAIYGASKSAIDSVMKTSARELAAKKIRVNSVNPGMVETKLIHVGVISEEQLENDKKTYPLQRYGNPIDIALGIVYLLSDASSWVTGHPLVIDGGKTI